MKNTKKCPACGRTVFTDFFGGSCSSHCVEIQVDNAIMQKHEDREDREWREEQRFQNGSW